MDISLAVRNLMQVNRRQFGQHQFTVPSSDIYPFQWLWDSCFHAIILSHFDLQSAKRELQAATAHPLSSGMLPHMIYWQATVAGEKERSTIPNWGRESRGSEINLAWQEKKSSTITQPPIVAMAVKRVFTVDNDKVFLQSIYNSLKTHFEYLARDRTFNDDALIYIINPDESGEDNSPRYDELLHLSHQHSANESLDKRLALMKQNAECNFVAKLCMRQFFGTADVSFNVLYAEDLQAMAEIAHALGLTTDAEIYAQRAINVQCDLMTQLRHEKLFLSFDFINKKHIPVLTWNIFMPLYGGFLTNEEAEFLVKTYLTDFKYFRSDFGIVTTAKTESAYDPNDGFWRGPIWLAPHWFIYHGLKRYGFIKEADEIKTMTLKLLEKSGFREHYHPNTGEGMGAYNFTWGGLVLDM